MAKKGYLIGFERELMARIDTAANAAQVSRQHWIARACEIVLSTAKDLGPYEAPISDARAEALADEAEQGYEVFTCPVPGCDHTALSPKAWCPRHNRTVRLAR